MTNGQIRRLKSRRDAERLCIIRSAMNELITIENLRKSFGESLALHDINLKVFTGELSVIVGPSGCGKSTLLRCINGLELFDSGCVRVGNTVLNRTEELTGRELNVQLRHLRER